MKSLTRGLLSAALLSPALAPAQPQTEPAPAPAPAKTSTSYALEPGARLEYVTSASLSGEAVPNGPASGQFRIAFTVLSKDQDGRTLFAAVYPQKDEKSTATQDDEIGGRFTFQIQSDGSLGERTAGISIPPFMGWSPMLYFPPIPDDAKTTMPFPLPALGMEIPVAMTRSTQNGDVGVDFKFDKSLLDSAGGEEAEGPIADFSGRYVYTPAEKSVKSSNFNLEARQRAQTGETQSVRLAYDATRSAASTVPAAELEALRKDVTAGIKSFDQVRQAMGSPEQNTTAAVEAIDQYLKEFPKGEFSIIYAEQKKAFARMAQMAAKAAHIKEGSPAPDFTAKSLDGETLKLSDLRGRVVLLDFWATWCGPCVREIPALKELYSRFKDKGFTIVGVSGDREEKDLRDFVSDNELQWKQIYQDPSGENTVLEQYGIEKFPTTILVNRDGTIQAIDLRGTELEQAVEALIEKK